MSVEHIKVMMVDLPKNKSIIARQALSFIPDCYSV